MLLDRGIHIFISEFSAQSNKQTILLRSTEELGVKSCNKYALRSRRPSPLNRHTRGKLVGKVLPDFLGSRYAISTCVACLGDGSSTAIRLYRGKSSLYIYVLRTYPLSRNIHVYTINDVVIVHIRNTPSAYVSRPTPTKPAPLVGTDDPAVSVAFGGAGSPPAGTPFVCTTLSIPS